MRPQQIDAPTLHNQRSWLLGLLRFLWQWFLGGVVPGGSGQGSFGGHGRYVGWVLRHPEESARNGCIELDFAHETREVEVLAVGQLSVVALEALKLRSAVKQQEDIATKGGKSIYGHLNERSSQGLQGRGVTRHPAHRWAVDFLGGAGPR